MASLEFCDTFFPVAEVLILVYVELEDGRETDSSKFRKDSGKNMKHTAEPPSKQRIL